MNLLHILKYYGRGIVLPVESIKRQVQLSLADCPFNHITDFGSGTLFWSKWFADELNLIVTAVDQAYRFTLPPKNNSVAIIFSSDICQVLDKKPNGAIFICDVIHHLPPDFWQSILPQIMAVYEVVIIKDIDGNHKLGNFCNRIHDRIINGEKIHNVYPEKIEHYLQESGFTTIRKDLPKLWYPHFIITAIKKNITMEE